MIDAKLLHWRDPAIEPPDVIGTILVLMPDFQPCLVNIYDDGDASYTDGILDTVTATSDQWIYWSEIPLP